MRLLLCQVKIEAYATVLRSNAETGSIIATFKKPCDGVVLIGAHAKIGRELNESTTALGLKAGIGIERHWAELYRDGIGVHLAIACDKVASKTACPEAEKRMFVVREETMRTAMVKLVNR
jgi:hypothetical protein